MAILAMYVSAGAELGRRTVVCLVVVDSSCSLRESESGKVACLPGRYRSVYENLESFSAQRICRSEASRGRQKYSRALWSDRIENGRRTLRSSGLHAFKQSITASNSLSWIV